MNAAFMIRSDSLPSQASGLNVMGVTMKYEYLALDLVREVPLLGQRTVQQYFLHEISPRALL